MPTTEIPRTQAQRRAETERRVLDAATRLIAAGGSRGVSLADIGREAGYSRGIVTHQFGSKQALLAALVERSQASLEVPEREDGLEQVLLLLELYLDMQGDQSAVTQAFLLLWAEAVAGEPGLQEIFAERDGVFRAGIARWVRRGIEQGSIRADADPEGVAMMIVGLLRGVALQRMLAPDATGAVAARAVAVELVRRGLVSPAR